MGRLAAYDRMTALTDIGGGTTSYTYDALGRVATVAAANRVTGTYSYDLNGQLLQVLHRTASGGIVTGVRHQLSASGQRLFVEEFDSVSTMSANGPANPVRSRSYTYDSTGRLTGEVVTDRNGTLVRTTVFEYDNVGNRTVKTETTAMGVERTAYSYDRNDRLLLESRNTATGSGVLTAYSWDENGNMTSKTTGGDSLFYAWSSDNRLVEVKQGASAVAAVVVARYKYDPNGHQVEKIEPGFQGQEEKRSAYLVDATLEYAQVVRETVIQGAVRKTADYVWGHGLVGQTRDRQRDFYHADGLGSITALTDTSGNITNGYSAFSKTKCNTFYCKVPPWRKSTNI